SGPRGELWRSLQPHVGEPLYHDDLAVLLTAPQVRRGVRQLDLAGQAAAAGREAPNLKRRSRRLVSPESACGTGQPPAAPARAPLLPFGVRCLVTALQKGIPCWRGRLPISVVC